MLHEKPFSINIIPIVTDEIPLNHCLKCLKSVFHSLQVSQLKRLRYDDFSNDLYVSKKKKSNWPILTKECV